MMIALCSGVVHNSALQHVPASFSQRAVSRQRQLADLPGAVQRAREAYGVPLWQRLRHVCGAWLAGLPAGTFGWSDLLASACVFPCLGYPRGGGFGGPGG